MTIDDISFQGRTMQEIADLGFPHSVSFLVTSYREYNLRGIEDDKIQWMTDRALIQDEDFYLDIFGVDPDSMSELWAFKDGNTAMLFKLTFV